MAEAASVDFRLSDKVNRLEDVVYQLSKTIQEHDLLSDEFIKLGEVKPSVKSVRDRQLAELRKMWKLYKPPAMSFTGYLTYCNQFFKAEHDRAAARNFDRARTDLESELTRRGPRVFQSNDRQDMGGFLYHEDLSAIAIPPHLAESKETYKPEKFVVYENGAAIAIDLVTLQPFTRPLKFNRDITMDLFANQIQFYARTTIPDLPATYRKALLRCQQLGFDKEQVQTFLKKFVETYFPSFLYVLQNSRTPTEVFENALALIDGNEVLSQINGLISSFKRPKSQSIKETFYHFLTLTRLRLSLREPGLSPEGLERKAHRLSTNQIGRFTNPEMLTLFESYVRDLHQHGSECTAEMAIRFISNMEANQPHLAPQGDIFYHEDQQVTLEMNKFTRSALAKAKEKLNKGLERSRKERSDKGKKKNKKESSTPLRSRSPSVSRPVTEVRSRSPSAQSAREHNQTMYRSRSPSASSVSSVSSASTEKSYNTGRAKMGFHSRQSSRSRERNAQRLQKYSEKASKINKKISKLNLYCNKCGYRNHNSRNCEIYKYSKTKCKICKDLYHATEECRKKKQSFLQEN